MFLNILRYNLLTKTFLNFTFFFFFCFFVFSPVTCLCPTATPHHFSLFPIIMSNYRSTKHLTVTTHYNLYSLYLSFYFFYLYNARQQEPQTQSQSQKPKTKKKTQTVQFSGSAATQAPNQFSNFSSSVKTQTRNTQTPQAQFL